MHPRILPLTWAAIRKKLPAMKIVSFLTLCTAVAAVASLTFSSLRAADDHDHEVIESAMKKYHKAPKGTDPVAKKAAKGEASKEQIAELLAAYEGMAEVKPPRGEQSAWDKRMEELVAATKDLQAGKDGSVETFKKAGDCKACHTDFKPKKKEG